MPKGKKGFQKGHLSYLTEESKEKISKAHKGKKFLETHKNKLSQSHIGKKLSEETKNKIKKAMIGKKHWNWKGGITSLNEKIRCCSAYFQWRSKIFERDDYTCQICKVSGMRLEADHYPQKFSDIIKNYKIKKVEDAINCEQLWNINNGRTLCKNCHLRIPSHKVVSSF